MTTSKVKLTDAFIARATVPAGKTETVIWDAEVTGFGLRLRGNAKTYVVSYRSSDAGRSANIKRVKLGTSETIKTATVARKLARALLGKVAFGGDPVADREEQSAAAPLAWRISVKRPAKLTPDRRPNLTPVALGCGSGSNRRGAAADRVISACCRLPRLRRKSFGGFARLSTKPVHVLRRCRFFDCCSGAPKVSPVCHREKRGSRAVCRPLRICATNGADELGRRRDE